MQSKTQHPLAPYYATMVRRWHTNHHLSHTGDNLGAHGGRMALLARLVFHTPSYRLLMACVLHDLGEYVTGDPPYNAPGKEAKHVQETKALLSMGLPSVLDDEDVPRLKLLDNLDAYLWALTHKPSLKYQEDWREQYSSIRAAAIEQGVWDSVRRLVEAV